jgi:HlyD family secretion protein
LFWVVGCFQKPLIIIVSLVKLTPTGNKIMSRSPDESRTGEQPRGKSEVSWGVAVFVPLLIAAGVLSIAKWQQITNVNDKPVPTSSVASSINALGRLEPKGEVIKLSAPTAGADAASRVEQLLVREGERVKQGQIIAVLDNFSRNQAAVEEAKAKVQESRANLANIKAGSPRDIQAQNAVIGRLKAQLKGEADSQQATINRLQAQLKGERVSQDATVKRLQAELGGQTDSLQATVSRTQAERRNAQAEFGRYDKLFREGAISEQERDRRRLNAETSGQQVAESEANRKRAIATLQQQVAEARANQAKTITTLEQQIIEAQASRTKTVASLQRQIDEESAKFNKIRDVSPTDVQIAQAQVSNAIANLRQAEAQINLSYIKAPSPGEVLKIYARPGESMTAQGIAEIGRTDEMLVVAEIPEDNIDKVRLGQKAIITSDNGAFSGQLQGTVTEIGRKVGKKDVLNTDPAADVDARVVEVKIALPSKESETVSGLTFAKVLVEIAI